MNKIIFTIALLFGVMLSCENVEVAETEEFVLTEIEVNEILDSDEFKKIRHASNKFFKETAILLAKEYDKNHAHFKEENANEDIYGFISEFQSSQKFLQLNDFYSKELENLSLVLMDTYPKLHNSKNSQYLVDSTHQIATHNENHQMVIRNNNINLRGVRSYNDPCQRQFENSFHYIHGQYDATIFGAAVSIASGIYTGGIGAVVGGAAMIFGVGRALGSLTWAMYEYSVCSGKLGKLVEMLEDMPVDGGLPVEKEGTNKNSGEE